MLYTKKQTRRNVMKMFKRSLCFILVLCFVAAVFVGCGKKNEENKGTEAPTGGNNVTPELTQRPTNVYGEESFTGVFDANDMDFENEEVTVLIRQFIHNSREWYKESPEDELDEAIAMRNSAVADELNLDVQFQWVPSNGNDYTAYTQLFHDTVTSDIMNKFHYYDISANFGYPTTYIAIRDFTTNLRDKELFPYFNFDLPCWNQAIVNNTTFNDQLFYVAGDINLSMFDAAMVVWHNKTLYDENKEPTDPENIQLLALEGKWTYDELHRWTSTFFEDTNGQQGKQKNDTYALMASASEPCPRDAFPYAWELEFVIENPDKTHEFNIIGNDKVETALTRYRTLVTGEGTVDNWDAANFAAGNAMFFMERIYSGYGANMAIREMNDKYGLLPMPKYDTLQDQYATTAQDYYTLMFVLDHADSPVPTKGEAVSAYLQFATEESYTGVRGYYFNRIIKPKFFGTDDSEGTVTNSVALFDIIVANIKFDYCYIYSPQLADINHLWRSASHPNSTGTFESAFRAKQDAFESAIKSTDAWLGLRSDEE